MTKQEYQHLRELEKRDDRAANKRIRATESTGEFSARTNAAWDEQKRTRLETQAFKQSLLAEGKVDEWQATHHTSIWRMMRRMPEIREA